jgi:diadenosine tetraphosphate (Ap4A) HIT family hydrolase
MVAPWGGPRGLDGARGGCEADAVFTPDPAFQSTSQRLTDLTLCQARLQLDARWHWLVLIPAVAGLVEIEELAPTERARLMEEIVLAGEAVRAIGEVLGRPVEKLNVGALGNITRQLHVHVVGRRRDDPAWPGPVWGVGVATPFAGEALDRARAAALAVLAS